MPEDEDTTILGQIRLLTKQEGLIDGSPEFDKRYRQLHVIQCREMHGVPTCQECPNADYCELYASVKRDYYGT